MLAVMTLVLLLTLSGWLVVHVVSTRDTNPLNDSAVVQTLLFIVVYAFTLALVIFIAHLTNVSNIAHRYGWWV